MGGRLPSLSPFNSSTAGDNCNGLGLYKDTPLESACSTWDVAQTRGQTPAFFSLLPSIWCFCCLWDPLLGASHFPEEAEMRDEGQPWAQTGEMCWGRRAQSLVPHHPLQPPLLPGPRLLEAPPELSLPLPRRHHVPQEKEETP